MVLLANEIAKFLNCHVKDLRDRLNHPEERKKVNLKFFGSILTTTYKDRNGFKKTFSFDEISDQGANNILAYGKLRKPFNCSVAAHFYARHRIRLLFPYHPCVIEKFSTGENRYYPLELLEVKEICGKKKEDFICQKCKNSTNSNSPKLVMDDSQNDDDYEEAETWMGRELFSQRW